MKIPTAVTKITPPRRHRNLLSRPRLHALVDDALDYRLFLVIAPAGYGKTALLTDWIGSASFPVAWYTITAMDLDTHRFYAHFVAALQRTFPGFGAETYALIDSLRHTEHAVEQLVITMVNELADYVTEDFVFILDDYHQADEEEEINRFVSQFVQHMSAACHVILISRTLVTLPDLDLLVARGAANGLGYADLAFRPEEIQTLCRLRFGRQLSPQEAASLTQMTEGWITGFLMSAHLQQWHTEAQLRRLKATGIDLYTYFAQQVLDIQAPHIRDFLLATSLFDEFDAALCAAILTPDSDQDRMDPQAIVDYLRTNNLFVTEVGGGDQIRYHGLFQEFLRDRFIREQPDTVRVVTKRLSDTYAAGQQWEEAYQLLTSLGDVPPQVAFLLEYGLQILRAGRMQLLVRWLEDLPDAVRLDETALTALHGSALIATGATDYGLVILSQSERLLRHRQDPALLVRVLAYRSAGLRLQGDYAAALRDADEALTLVAALPQPADPAAGAELQENRALCLRLKGLALYMMGEPTHLEWLEAAHTAYSRLQRRHDMAVVAMEMGLAHAGAGNYRQAMALYKSVADTWERLHNLAGQANVLNNLGALHFLHGDYQEASTVLLSSLHAAERSGYRRIEAFALTGLADVMAMARLTDAAAELYGRAFGDALALNERYLLLYLELAKAKLAIAQDDSEGAYRFLNQAGNLVLSADSLPEWSHYQLAMGHYYLHTGSPTKAVPLLEPAVEYFGRANRSAECIAAQLYLAFALATDDPGRARHVLAQALKTAAGAEHAHHLVALAAAERERLDLLATRDDAPSELRAFSQQVAAFAAELPALQTALHEIVAGELSAATQHVPTLAVRAFGSPEVYVHGHRVSNGDWTALAARDLFFCLLTHEEGLTKEEIGLIFWPDCSPNQLKSRFKNTIYRLRSATTQETIRFQDEIYSFNRTLDVTYDVDRFHQHLQTAAAANDPHQRLEHLQAALHLYQGPFLAPLEAAWIYPVRAQLHRRFVAASLELSELLLAESRYEDVMDYSMRLCREEPGCEQAYRLAMEAAAATGNRAEVAKLYTQCISALKEEVDANPSQQTVQLFESLMQTA